MKNLLKCLIAVITLFGSLTLNAQATRIVIVKDSTGKEIVTGTNIPNGYTVTEFVKNKLKNPSYYLFLQPPDATENYYDNFKFYFGKLGEPLTEGKIIEVDRYRGGQTIKTMLGAFDFPGPADDGSPWRHFKDGTKQELIDLNL